MTTRSPDRSLPLGAAEEAFLDAIFTAPDDDGPRLMYADWLAERGDIRGDYLLLECELAALPSGTERHWAVQSRLEALRQKIDTRWLLNVVRPLVEKCEATFKFRCPLRWDHLTRTNDDRVRFCDTCQKKVHYCDNIEQALHQAGWGNCIALAPSAPRRPGDLAEAREYLVMGRLAIPRRDRRDELKPGGRVRIRDGAFASKEGVIKSVNTRRRSVRAWLPLFGRKVLVELEWESVVAVAVPGSGG